MIQLFKSNNPSVIFLLIFLALGLHLQWLLHPQIVIFSSSDILHQGLLKSIVNPISSYPTLYAIIAITIIIIQALLWNTMLNNYRLLPQQNYLPSLIYITFTAAIPDFYFITQATWVAFIVIWALYKLINIYRKENQTVTIFDLGFSISVAALIGAHFITLLIFLIIALLILRSLLFKEWINMLIGLFVPFFLVGTWWFYNDMWSNYTHSFFNNLHFHTKPYIKYSISFYAATITTIIAILSSYFLLNSVQLSRLVMVRKFFNLQFHLVWIVGLSWFLNADKSFSQFYLWAIPISFYFAYYLCVEKKKWKANWWYGLWLGAILFSQYVNFLNIQ